jgi:hypothetical protein
MCANALDFHEFSKLGWIDLQEPTKVDLRVADEYLRTLLMPEIFMMAFPG